SVSDKCSTAAHYSRATITDRPADMVELSSNDARTSNKYNSFPANTIENKEEQDMIKAIEESLKENQNIPGFSPIAQCDPENPHERSRSGLTPVGLKNMGNSCWFNVISQTLFHIAQFRQLLMNVDTVNLPARGSNPWTSEPSSSSEPTVTPQTLLLTLRRLFASLLASGRGYVDPSDVLSTISELNSTLSKAVPSIGVQQDATEMLLRLIEWLEQALKQYVNKSDGMISPAPVEGDQSMLPVNDENVDPGVSELSQQAGLVASPSDEMAVDGPVTVDSSLLPPAEHLPFNALFHGSHIEMRLSNDGSTTSSKLDNSVQMVNLDVSFDNLHDSLEAYHFADSPAKEVWFETLPAVIMFSLVRFSYKNGQTEKLHNKFHFPISFFMDRYMHRNREIVIEKKRHRTILKERMDVVKAQLSRLQNFPIAEGTESVTGIIDAVLSFKSAFLDSRESSDGCGDHLQQAMDVCDAEPSSLTEPFAPCDVSIPSDVRVERTANANSSETSRIRPIKISVPADDLVVFERVLRHIGNEMERCINELTSHANELRVNIESIFDTDGMRDEGYRLHSVIIHEGEANVGHYWAYIADYSTLDDEGSPTAWRKFNDKSVEPATWSQIEEDSFGSRRACSAYCLVYTRKKCERELFQQDSTASLKTLAELVESLPEDLRADVALDNDAFAVEIAEWDKQRMTPPASNVGTRPIFDLDVMMSFSHKTPFNVQELSKKYYTQAYRYFGTLFIKRVVEKTEEDIAGSRIWEDDVSVAKLLDDVLKYYSTILASVHSGDSQLENLDRRLLLPEWMRMCSIPLSIIAQRVFMLRMLLCTEKPRLRVACSAKLHAIHGSMPLANFEVINDELDDAHILYEIFWQAVAVLADITCKISKETSLDLKHLVPQTKLLCVAIRMLDKIVPYMKDGSVEARERVLFDVLVDYLLIYYAVKITQGLVDSVVRHSSEQKLDDNAVFLSREYKAIVLRIRRMKCAAGNNAVDFILKIWTQVLSGSKELFKVASFRQMIVEATSQENNVEMPAVPVNVAVQETVPDLFRIRSFMQKMGLRTRDDLLPLTSAVIGRQLISNVKVASDS
uniref:USP domain-containing protein n=2 Tax=Parascaris TaxID=6254 RepID=A0A915AFQ9_PARUN